MDYELIKYLRDMGIIDTAGAENKSLVRVEDRDNSRYAYLDKNYFDDPRDENGEVYFQVLYKPELENKDV